METFYIIITHFLPSLIRLCLFHYFFNIIRNAQTVKVQFYDFVVTFVFLLFFVQFASNQES